MVSARIMAYPSSGEINSEIENPQMAIQRVQDHYEDGALGIDHTDGISLEFDQWRFSLRCSNTEPVVLLNVEARGDITLMEVKTREILSLLRQGSNRAVNMEKK